jgi:ribulose-bisphosphate carboxylase large chain
MNTAELTNEAVAKPRKRYDAGVLKYRGMGYWERWTVVWTDCLTACEMYRARAYLVPALLLPS